MWSVLKRWFGESKSNEALESAETPTFPPEWLCELKDPVDWCSFYDFELIRGWADQMVVAREAKSRESWLINGPNLLLIGDEAETLSKMVQMAANQAGFRHIRVPATAIAELLETPRKSFESIAPVVVQLDAGDWCCVKGEPESIPPDQADGAKYGKRLILSSRWCLSFVQKTLI